MLRQMLDGEFSGLGILFHPSTPDVKVIHKTTREAEGITSISPLYWSDSLMILPSPIDYFMDVLNAVLISHHLVHSGYTFE